MTELLSQRDGCDLEPEHVGRALFGFDEAYCVTWLAEVGGAPAASTALYLRTLCVPGRSEQPSIGYWAHLFVLPEYRKLMLYPQLVFAMRKAMAELGLDMIITATRRPAVVEGHLKLGFKGVCSWRVLVKPLKPFALLAKHKGIKVASLVAPAGDALWSAGQSILTRGGESGVELQTLDAASIQHDADLLDQLCELLADSAGQRAATDWTPDLLRIRLDGCVDGEPYTAFLAKRDGVLVGVAMCRLATRGNNIRTGVILELAARDDDRDVLRSLATASERELAKRGAEAMLWLDGAGEGTSDVLRGMGYRVAADEMYRFIAFDPSKTDEPLPSGAPAWRFTFLDHDAF